MTQILFFLLALILFSVTTLGINYLINSQKYISPSDSKNESEKNETLVLQKNTNIILHMMVNNWK